jgi:plastocyanin
MNELYRRVLIPLAISLAAVGVIVLVVLDLSRAELALAGKAATIVAVVAASAILIGAALLSRREGTSVALRVLLMAGFVLVFGGLVGLARLDEEKAQAAHVREAREAVNEGPPNATITAFDIGFREHQVTVPAGLVRIAYVDDGQLAHTLVIDGVPTFKRLEVRSKGDRVIGATDFKPGTYIFYCDVPGHRQAGMQGTLTVT